MPTSKRLSKNKSVPFFEAFITARDTLGNETLAFQWTHVAPYATRILQITVDLKMASNPQPMPEAAPERFLRAEPFIEVHDPAIVAAAQPLRRDTPLASSQSSYDWVSRILVAAPYTPEERGALYALRQRRGDCTEFAYLLTALLRVNQIPARAIGGFVFTGNALVKASAYHNWTEWYDAGTWQLADAQQQHFQEHQPAYVAWRILAADSAGPLQQAHRFRFAGTGLSVVME